MNTTKHNSPLSISLPPPRHDSPVSLEKTLLLRRSRRNFIAEKALDKNQLGQILWAAQGITNDKNFRAAPSAGAIFPLETYVVIGNVTDVPAGIYHYNIKEHALKQLSSEDVRENLYLVCLRQTMIKEAPLSVVLAANYTRIKKFYRVRAVRYTAMEIGHAGQNIYLQCEALGLGTCAIGAFREDAVKKLFNIQEEPLYIMPVGYSE